MAFFYKGLFMHANEASANVLINARRGKWAEFFAMLEPFDLSEVLKDSRANDTQRPVDDSWLILE